MADLSSGSLFFRAIDVLPVLTPEMERELSVVMRRARLGLFRAFWSSPPCRAALVGDIEALAGGGRMVSDTLDRSYWGMDDGTLPGSRRAELLSAVRLMAGEEPPEEAVEALHVSWVQVERLGCTISPEGFTEARRAYSEVLDRLVESNLRLVVKWVRRCGMFAPGDEMDLVQEGCEGLIAAARRFDFGRGFRFSTYAVWWIRQAVLKAMVRNARLIRLPVHLAALQSEIRRAASEYAARHGRQPGEDELAECLGVGPDLVRAVMRTSGEPLSLDRTLGEDSDGTIHDVIGSRAPGPDDLASRRDVRERVARSLDRLPPRERDIVVRRFGLAGEEPESLARIGRDLGLSRERVRQLELRALGRLRALGLLFPDDGDGS